MPPDPPSRKREGREVVLEVLGKRPLSRQEQLLKAIET